MHPLLKTSFTQMENSKLNFIALLEQIPRSFLNQKKESSWSINETLEHLILVDRKTLISVKGSEEKRKKIGLKSSFNSFLLNQFLRLPFRYKVPLNAIIYPQSKTSTQDMLNEWNLSRVLWSNYLQDFPLDKFHHSVFKHPYVGLLNIEQTLFFIGYHCKHHQFQVNRILKLLNNIKTAE